MNLDCVLSANRVRSDNKKIIVIFTFSSYINIKTYIFKILTS